MQITKNIFNEQCKPRFGCSNPERMHLAYWDWMVRSGKDPHFVRNELGLDSNFPRCGSDQKLTFDGPDWCFDRFGRTRTVLPDGRIVCIAGEHEDYYDPDFCIYNDVIVLRPGFGQPKVTADTGEVEIYGYPENVFSPTDFHSATLVEARIFIIGRLGYAGTRREGETPVVALDLSTYQIEPIKTRGPAPGWLYEHSGSYDKKEHAIIVRGGKLWRASATSETPNYAAHRLHLADMRWERIAEKETHRYYVIRRTRREKQCADLQHFRPSVPHEWIGADEGEQTTLRFIVAGVRFTVEHWFDEVRVVVEGELPSDVRELVVFELSDYLSEKEECFWDSEELTEAQWRLLFCAR